MKVRLSKLPKILPGIHAPVEGAVGETEVLGIAHDSRRVKAGWVFVGIPGLQRDGAEFAEDAVGRGAIAVVAERRVRLSDEVPRFLVHDARRALAALANSFFGRPSRHLQVIGVTGTNGKTTTTYMVRAILEAAGHRCGLLGTISYETGRRTLPAAITTPESVDIQEFLSEMVAEGMDYAAIEVSSHGLCMNRVDFVRFAAGVFTNLSPEHMDYHRTLPAYREAKARLFRCLGPASHAILNSDDKHSGAMERATFAKVTRYGLRKGADMTAEVEEATVEGIRMTLSCDEGRVKVAVPLVGVHNVYNALAAGATALALGYDLGVIREGLERMPCVPGRLEPVPTGNGCKVLVDYAHTDRAMEVVLDSLRDLTAKRILLVFGAGGDRDRSKRPRMGAVAEKGADVVWITSDNPRSEEPMEIIEDILLGVRKRKAIRVQPDREAAIAEALAEAERGDLVLIAGKGHERTQRFRDTVVPFDDREAVQRALMGGTGERSVIGA